MNSIFLYGYEFDVNDLLSTGGVILTAATALIAVLLNHYFSMRRLRIELKEQDKQRELDRLSRFQEERLKNYLHNMERLFEFTLELKSIHKDIQDDLNKVDSISAAVGFSKKLRDFANDLDQLDNKLRVVINVYFHDESLDIDIIFISHFSCELISQYGEFEFLSFDDFASDDEAFEHLSSIKRRFESELNCFVENIWSLEGDLVEKIESEHGKLHDKQLKRDS